VIASTVYQYDIALSFAGEDRAYVEEVATFLKGRGVRVFYDRSEEVDLWGKDLYVHLDEVYRQKSRFCVMFISENYAKKLWTNHERTSAQARAFLENKEYVLPARFDETRIPGLRPTIGYVDLSVHSPRAFARMVLQKIGPVARGPFVPDDLGRLYRRLRVRSKKAKEHVHDELQLLTEDERRLVFWIFSQGCPGDLPGNMHIHLERLERGAGFEIPRIRELAKHLSAFGFDVRVRRGRVEIEVWDNRVSEEAANITDVFEALISIIGEEHCIECGERLFLSLDFGPLSPGYPEI